MAIVLILGMALMMVISTVLTVAVFLLTDGQSRKKIAVESVVELLQDGVSYDHTGKFVLEVEGVIAEKIIRLSEEQSEFWYFVSDGTQTIIHGAVPASVQDIIDTTSPQVFSSEFSYMAGQQQFLGLRKLNAEDPPKLVVVGGVTFSNAETLLVVLREIWPQGLYHLLGIVLVATATIAVVAVKRTIATPVRRVVDSAEQIDGLPNGRRISDRDTPIELKPMVAAFNTALGCIDNAFEAQRNFLANASHELRTPLTKLRLKLDLVQDPDVREVLVRDTARLASIVTTSLQLARLSGQALTFTMVDLAAIARAAIAEHVPSVMKQGMDIEFKAEGRVIVPGSEPAIRLALDNLIINAMRHARGTEVLVVEVLQARIVRVSDEGPGIPAAEREKMLRPFVRGNTSASEGTGMGLAIVAQIMTAHNGSVALGEAANGGLVVDLAFPKTAKESAFS
ncbi:sensor histidine kinase [Ensifer adhaerens]|uniref:sensor histidine kinase n=1 Tax=Ensifer adhaerens TaxID=106592 RepID=UPI001C4E14F5|nr:HAMP domain-containing sensor histidine kinase [Ensifer adhaerens]MBW0371249.1 HAMP domain-containing histidine kinase [Ensifer adhaerens]UCM23794.1 HAMP domain-containing histidine kinase [Ensifer adhaerens]